MTCARGLTLLETVAAAALLAVLGAAGASLLVDARQRVGRPEPSATVNDLSRLADVLVEDPAEVGFAGTVEEMDGATLPWPVSFELVDAPPVALRLVETTGFETTELDEEPARRAWLILECDGFSIARWVELPEEESP